MSNKYSKLMKQFQDKEAENRQLRNLIGERDQKIATLESTASVGVFRKSKFAEFWNSTPVWGALGVLAGVVLSQFASRADLANIGIALCFFAVWVVFCFEFWRLHVLEKGRKRIMANCSFSIIMAALTVLGWWYLPKAKNQPDSGHAVVAELRIVAPWIFEKPAPVAASPIPIAIPSPDEVKSDQIEVYFGTPGASRGTVVTVNGAKEREKLFVKAIEGGTFNARILPGYANQTFQDIPIIVRNISRTVVQNARIEVYSSKFIQPVTAGARSGNEGVIYDIPELYPYSDGGKEFTLIVRIQSNSSAFDPTPILVTIYGKELLVPHSEIMKYTFTPLPA